MKKELLDLLFSGLYKVMDEISSFYFIYLIMIGILFMIPNNEWTNDNLLIAAYAVTPAIYIIQWAFNTLGTCIISKAYIDFGSILFTILTKLFCLLFTGVLFATYYTSLLFIIFTFCVSFIIRNVIITDILNLRKRVTIDE